LLLWVAGLKSESNEEGTRVTNRMNSLSSDL
jgi:hypothetical protein